MWCGGVWSGVTELCSGGAVLVVVGAVSQSVTTTEEAAQTGLASCDPVQLQPPRTHNSLSGLTAKVVVVVVLHPPPPSDEDLECCCDVPVQGSPGTAHLVK